MAGKYIHISDICKYRHIHSILIYMEFKLIFLKDKLSILSDSLVGISGRFLWSLFWWYKSQLGFLGQRKFLQISIWAASIIQFENFSIFYSEWTSQDSFTILIVDQNLEPSLIIADVMKIYTLLIKFEK